MARQAAIDDPKTALPLPPVSILLGLTGIAINGGGCLTESTTVMLCVEELCPLLRQR